MKTTPQTFFPLITALVLFTAAAAQATDITFDWVSLDGDPGGIRASITFDSTSGVDGLPADDIVSLTVGDTYTGIRDETSAAIYFFYGGAYWNPTTITQLEIETISYDPFYANFLLLASPGGNQIEDNAYGAMDLDGRWVNASAVPDQAATLPLLFSAAGSLLLYRRRFCP